MATTSLSPRAVVPIVPAPPIRIPPKRVGARRRWRVAAAAAALAAWAASAHWQQLIGLWGAYESAAISRPLATKAATSGVAYCLGDVASQALTEERIDARRTARSSVAGFVSHGPQLHFWTLLLERHCSFGGAAWALPVKIVLDQTVFSLYLNSAYVALMEALRASWPAEIWRRVRCSALPSLKAGWKFWPAVHALTYSVVPLHLRVLWVDVVEVGWVAILSSCVARAGRSSTDLKDLADPRVSVGVQGRG